MIARLLSDVETPAIGSAVVVVVDASPTTGRGLREGKGRLLR